jgi:catechol 2,3-dioxygenase-like lactoylglutathione lyase family enzyme
MPAPRLLLAIPVLPVGSIEETLIFFESKLGFRRHIDSDDYAGVERDGLQIHFWLCADPGLPKSSSCRLNVAGVDAFYAECLRAGVVAEGDAPAEKPWGFREFTVVDPSGNLVVFAEEIEGWVEE